MKYPSLAVFRRLLLASSCMAGMLVSASAQDTLVTFYSHGSLMKSGVPGTNHGIFYGCIYDGAQRIACFRDGLFMKNNRFVVFRLAAGLHTFSASYSKHPAKNSQFAIQVEPGKNLFLRVQSESRGVIGIEFERGRLDQVTCDVAQREIKNGKALDVKKIPAAMRASLDPMQVIPSCP
jgi:hypothetical protein